MITLDLNRKARWIAGILFTGLILIRPGTHQTVRAEEGLASTTHSIIDRLKSQTLRLSNQPPSFAKSFQFEFRFGTDINALRRVIVESNGRESALLYLFADGVPFAYFRAGLRLFVDHREPAAWEIGRGGFDFSCIKIAMGEYGLLNFKQSVPNDSNNVSLELSDLVALFINGERPAMWTSDFDECTLLGALPKGSRVRIDVPRIDATNGRLFPIRRWSEFTSEGSGIAFCRFQVNSDPLRSILSFSPDTYPEFVRDAGNAIGSSNRGGPSHFDPRIPLDVERDKTIRKVGLALLKQFPARFDVVEEGEAIKLMRSIAATWPPEHAVVSTELRHVRSLLRRIIVPTKRQSANDKWSPFFDPDEPYLRFEIACGPEATQTIVEHVSQVMLDPARGPGVRAAAIAILSDIGPPVGGNLMEDAARAFAAEDGIPARLLYAHASLQARYGTPTERTVELLHAAIRDVTIDPEEQLACLASLGILNRGDVPPPLLSELLPAAIRMPGGAIEVSRALAMNSTGQAALMNLIETHDLRAPRKDMLTALSESVFPTMPAWDRVLRLAAAQLQDKSAPDAARAAAFVIAGRDNEDDAGRTARIRAAAVSELPLLAEKAFREIHDRKLGVEFLDEIRTGLEVRTKATQLAAAFALVAVCVEANPKTLPSAAVQRVHAMLAHDNSEVRVAALRALGKLDGSGIPIDAATRKTVVVNALNTDDLYELIHCVDFMYVATRGKLEIEHPRYSDLTSRMDQAAMQWWAANHTQVRRRLKELAAELE